MSGISSIGNTYTDYGRLVSGKKLLQASDGAAELAMAQKLQVQTNTYDVGPGIVKQPKVLAIMQDEPWGGLNIF